MRWRLAMPLAALLSLAPSAPWTLADAEPLGFVRVKADTVNLRERPSTKSERVILAYEDDPLQVLGRRGTWLKVRDFQGYEGWIYRPLTDERPSVIVLVPVANLRSGPGTTHAIVYTADRGAAFRVQETRGDWLEVEHADGARGWIHRRLVWGADEEPPSHQRPK